MGSAAAAAATTAMLDGAGVWVVRVSLQAAVLATMVAAAQWALRGRLPARWRHALWWLVVLRLALPPGLPATPISIFNLAELPIPSPGGDVESSRPAPVAARPTAPTWEEELLAASDLAGPTLGAAGGGISPMPVASPAAPAPSPSPWTAVGLVWAAGCAATLAWQAVAAWRWRRRERAMRRVESGPAAELLRRCAAEMGLAPASTPALLVGDGIGAPALAGWWRPRVLLPAGVLATLRPRELRLVLLHELAHVRRRDVLVGRLLGALAAIHWFNPVVRWALGRMRQEAEAACDERVLAVAARDGEDARIEYGSAMLAVVEWLSGGGAAARSGAGGSPGVVGILGGRHLLKRRITMIARYDVGGGRGRRTGAAWAMAAALVLGAVGLTGGVRGQAGPASSSDDGGGAGNALRAAEARGATPAATRPAGGSMGPAAGGAYGGGMGGSAMGGRAPARPQRAAAAAPAFLAGGAADPRNARALEALRKELPEAKFDGQPLGEVIDFLRDATGVNVFVDWREIEGAGIARDAAVTLNLRDVQAGEVLRLALRSASRQLTARLQGGVVEIDADGDMAAADAELITCMYDVADLVGAGVGAAPAPAGRGTATSRFGGGFVGSGTSGTDLPSGAAGMPADAVSARMVQLSDLIRETVAPDTWRDNGGDEGSIRFFGTKLLIRATAARHQEVDRLLAMLREE